MKSVALTAHPRSLTRSTGTKKVRAQGRIPAVIYGRNIQPQNLEFERKELLPVSFVPFVEGTET